MGRELRFSKGEIHKRLKRISSNPPPKTGIKKEMSSFKAPPAVPIKIGDDELLFPSDRIGEFFGKSEDESEAYVKDCERVVSFIGGFKDQKMNADASGHLINILSQFGGDRSFLEMIEVADEIRKEVTDEIREKINKRKEADNELGELEITDEIREMINKRRITANEIREMEKVGPLTSLAFLAKISKESVKDWKRDSLIGVMPALRSKPIKDSFRLFAAAGGSTVQTAAEQIVELGFRLKETEAIEKIGKTITQLNEKFGLSDTAMGIFATMDYRVNVLKIANSNAIPQEKRAALVNTLSDRILKFEIEEDTRVFNIKISNLLARSDDPEEAIQELCKE